MQQLQLLDQLQQIRFIDLFAGIGGFHLALANQGAKCVFASEINENAVKTYLENHALEKEKMHGDITLIDPNNIPDHEVLCAGFPCQPFSQAGHKKGFEDVRGTLFFNILKILEAKQPKAYFLENVRGLLKHDDGRTFSIIKEKLENLGYTFQSFVVKSSDYGLPQHRPRLFMIGFKDGETQIELPEKLPLKLTMSDILEGNCEKEIGFTLRVGGRGSVYGDRRNWEFYKVDGEIRRITSNEGKLMQGFPKNFKFPVSEVEAMKQLGNSVSVDVIEAFYKKIKEKISAQQYTFN
ncbi:DNA cytosine methyltransferase [Acinetobacter bereziniae]|jgi:DNA (cytosine-5)-methyltransferase 1|uniref:DNA cytosine methyltransferase n=1 Tax=Acinetobacter bereziniae TaxID=106648 RepID=UPI0011169ACF|nr:DNA cytosine methyltransferase [Acinetobacter bereziniae]MBJ8451606.1 DNA cytosine methyltransferase [Acinetobacter bereziniae]MBJ8457017.1 DNA cytosine methyltransferase [Acinetobacter bereziniae]MDM1785891.1 DNA cytosine methyltransferase [Acinetobacter bereziniae]TNL50205.1 DNA cytosine methyltransferase [Acinetobacter bereziniae]TNL58753.1 DNA cytosine methyltransferase [Acinetobacter bereziniae]